MHTNKDSLVRRVLRPVSQQRGGARVQLRALVVDDDPLQLEVAADALRDLGVAQITTAAGGESAMRALGQSKTGPAFDVILCDLHMPAMDGFQFMDAVAKAGFRGAVIIVSGQSAQVRHSATLVAQLQRLNFLGELGKPLEKNALDALIAQIAR